MPLLIVVCGGLAYSSSFAGSFLFDDVPHILVNRELHTLWPPTVALGDSMRPVFFYSLALNYAVSGTSPWSYHLVNLLVHLAAALALFGLIRRSLQLPVAARFHGIDALALASALLWVVHPLTTQSVTYLVQRSEAMASLFYLLALYCFVRAVQGSRPLPWFTAAVGAVILALGSKEIAVTAPLLILLYDRCLVAGSFATALRRRWALYATFAMAPPLVLLLRWLAGQPSDFFFAHAWAKLTGQRVIPIVGGGFDFGPLPEAALTPFEYLLTQTEVVLHYMRLAIWPSPLIFDYAWPPATGVSDVVPALIIMATFLSGTAWALWRIPPVGFVAASFFVVLSVTSSIAALPDLAVEHRMYLPLAPLVVLMVLGAHDLVARVARPRLAWSDRAFEVVAAACLAAAVALLGARTFARNFDYRSEEVMWADVVDKRPTNARAHYNLGTLLAQKGRLDAAEDLLRRSIRLDPLYVSPHINLGMALAVRGRTKEAQSEYETALALQPLAPSAHNNIGTLLVAQGRRGEAKHHFELAISQIHEYSESEFLRMPLLAHAHTNLAVLLLEEGRLDDAGHNLAAALDNDPDFAPAHGARGRLLTMRGDLTAALTAYRKALVLDPSLAAAHGGAGEVLLKLGRFDEATDAYRRATRFAPGSAERRIDLASALQAIGDSDGAEAAYREALALDPAAARAFNGLGLLLGSRGDPIAAITAFQRAAAADPGLAEAYDNIGTTLADMGRHEEAVTAYLQALFVDPEFARAHNNLAVALWKTDRIDDAVSHLREALRLRPDYAQAKANLEKILDDRPDSHSSEIASGPPAANIDAVRREPGHEVPL